MAYGGGYNSGDGYGGNYGGGYALSGVSFDADAQAFITAAGISDDTQKNAINTLVRGLKTDGLWTKIYAIYPMVGGTASTHKYNLKDPRDLDAAFRLTFSGTWTHSATGAKPDGIAGYANTGYAPSVAGLTYIDNHISFYSRTTDTGLYNAGSGDNTATGSVSLYVKRDDNSSGYDCASGTLNRATFANAEARGFYLGTSTASPSRFYKNGVQQTTKSLSNVAVTSLTVYLGAYNNEGTAAFFSANECAFFCIGRGLTNSEAVNLSARVATLQTALGRQV